MEKIERFLESEQVLDHQLVFVRKETKLKQLWNVFKKDKLAVLGLIIILTVTVISVFAPLIAPYDPNFSDGSKRLLGIGTPGHILGVDDQGRDILSRLILGLIAGYWGGKTGEVIMRLLDVLFAFPTVLLAIVISAIMGAGLLTIMAACCLTMLPYMTRVVYTSTVTEKTKEYVEASKILGAKTEKMNYFIG